MERKLSCPACELLNSGVVILDPITHGVPNLEFHVFAVDVHEARTKFDANRQVVHRLEAFICELEEQAGLAHSLRKV